MSAARPILFSGPMIRALLDGRKNQTRRIMKPAFKGSEILNLKEHGGYSEPEYSGRFNDPDSWGYPFAEDGGDMPLSYWTDLCPYGSPGDLLWVRENVWVARKDCKYEHKAQTWVGYPADPKENSREFWESWGFKLAPAIHMPRSKSRLTLEITNVRAQRLRDISEADAIDEGMTFPEAMHYGNTPQQAFSFLWRQINGDGSWAENPWIWALTFKVHKCNVDALLLQKAA